MIIEISKIQEDGSTYAGAIDRKELGLEGDEVVCPTDDLGFEIRVELLGSEILVQGSTSLDLDCSCARCGEIFSTTLVDSSFLRAYECKPEMVEVDITEDLRESIILVLPPHPVCNDECRGLCSGCGINLNRDQCTCKKAAGNLCWSELNNLKLS